MNKDPNQNLPNTDAEDASRFFVNLSEYAFQQTNAAAKRIPLSNTLARQILTIAVPLSLVVPVLVYITPHIISPQDKIENHEELEADHQRHELINFLILMLMAPINLGIGLWLINKIKKSFAEISSNLHQAACGNLDVQMMATGSKEYQELANNFNLLINNFNLALRQQNLAAEGNRLFGQIAILASTVEDSLPIFDLVAHELQEILAADRVTIYGYIGNNDAIEIMSESLSLGQTSTIDSGLGMKYFEQSLLSKEQYRQGERLTIDSIDDPRLNDELRSLYADMDIQSHAIVPIGAGRQLIGAISIQQCRSNRVWQAWEVDFCARVAQQVALAIERVEAEIARQNEAGRSKMLSNALQLKLAAEVDRTLSQAVATIGRELDTDRAIIIGIDDVWEGKVVAEEISQRQRSADALDECKSILGEEVHDDRFNSWWGQVDTLPSQDEIATLEFNPDWQVKSHQIAPISIDGRLFGLAVAQICGEDREWQPRDIIKLDEIAEQLGCDLHPDRTSEGRERSIARATKVAEIILKLRQSSDPSEVLRDTMPAIQSAFEFDRLMVVPLEREIYPNLWDEATFDGETSFIDPDLDATTYLVINDRDRYQRGEAIGVTDTERLDVGTNALTYFKENQIRAYLAAPIQIGEGLFGLLVGHTTDRPRWWDRDEVEQLSEITNQMGIALNQAQLLERLAAASREQTKLASEQQAAKERMQQNAWDLLIQVDEISRGDLTIRAKVTNDEIGTIADSYNATVESLRQLVLSVQEASVQVVHTTGESGVSVAELSEEALRQAEEVGIAEHRLRSLTTSLTAVLNNAIEAEAAVAAAKEVVASGDAAMNRTVDGMIGIRNTVAETAKKVKRLGESSQKISKVVSLIGNFAAQTNLLALNASIEAARAGEEGRGFAVVAEEVRSLAKQSAQATAVIEKLVADIQSETSEVVMAMETGTEQVAIGTKLVDETKASLMAISNTSNQIGKLVETIAQAATIQSEHSIEVTERMGQVADIANRTSSRADLVQASFQELLQLAGNLQANIDRFKVDAADRN